MNDKKRYMVCCKNAKECRVELNFPDLCIHYTNGFSPSLKVMEGDIIPLEACDEEDIRKSLLVGSLKGYLANGWIQEIFENPIVKESPTPISQFITEQMVLAPKPDLVKPEVAPVQLEVPPTPNLPELEKVVDQPIFAYQNDTITDLKLVNSYEDFNKLSHFLKIRYIKESVNVDLLRQIQSLTTSAQFHNNINLRLSTLKI